MRNHFAKQNTHMKKDASKCLTLRIILLSLSLIFGSVPQSISQSSDEQDWWFNIELIAFSRVLLPSNTEDFSSSELNIDFSKSHPMLHVAALQQTFPTGANFPVCDTPSTLYPYIDVSFTYRPEDLFKPFETPAIKSVSDNKKIALNELDAQSLDNISSDESPTEPLPLQTLLSDLLDIKELSSNSPALFSQIEQDTLQNVLDSQVQSDVDMAIKTRLEALERIDEQLKAFDVFFDEFANIQRINCEPNPEELEGFNPYALKQIPQTLFAKQSFFNGNTQLVSPSEAFLGDYAQNVFRQRDITPLLHTAWRHNIVFGAENAQFFRIRAGKLLEVVNEQTYEQWHEEYLAKVDLSNTQEESNFFSTLKTAINSNEEVNWLALETTNNSTQETLNDGDKEYELDGIFKVFLDYVNQVPYLHIESEFAHYRMALNSDGKPYLQKYSSTQRRRIISKQIHYFDHPAFGIIVRLERFTPPEPTAVPEA